MRSKWEKAYAQYLDQLGIEWQYEAWYFIVGRGAWNGVTYVPDFYLPATDEFIEIKGQLSPAANRKLKAFQAQYPEVKWQMLRMKDLYLLGVVDFRGSAILK
jgi:hypothetical protein